MRMEQLRIFLTILESGSLSAASRLLHMSQPTVSSALAALEKEVGQKLIVRVAGQRKPLEPTVAGGVFAAYASDAYSQYQKMLAKLGASEHGMGGVLRIGVTATPSSSVLPVLASAFRKQYSDVKMTIKTYGGAEMLPRLRAGEFDIAITGTHPDGKELDFDRFFYDPVVLICPASMGIVGPITVRELTMLPLVLRNPSGNLTRLLMQALARAGVSIDSLNVVMQVSWNSDVFSAVSLGAGAGFVARSLLASDMANKNIVPVRIKRFRVDRYVYLVRKTSTPFAGPLRLFWQMALDSSWRKGVFGFNTMAV